mmetsp:Transcript_35627/g.76079  ORF Transcript_35627/g.76079 Transcript_35627/m.76079 type:complete len:335 (-) Transcript_35627:197-1201(-)|eukprot:CAMPEP_0172554340 /NCGR_PEP_ID=MMETSP1067-20121228/54090_1 /TAXON_ID=265564 ORGANISM="Thalassiosira punctigera, Strain Tpunct2005C2" /NCGR_SAMPLE_ID=MMETSP1067 /ASSEMBLY_ACC=CAM_ASM_000444 /LENGTH=334 /DNA_ID=CAMNT_0013342687 /DNA_START=115 /DNA_END=1119 /DNA_ORIENTATION=+
MCKPDNATSATAVNRKRRSSWLLLTHDSFVIDDIPDKDDVAKRQTRKNPYVHGLGGPSLASTLLTAGFYVAVLFVLEYLTRVFIGKYAHLDPLLENEYNRGVLARHIATDFVTLFACSFIAVSNRHINEDIIRHGLSYGKSDYMREEDFEKRVFAYHPGSQRLMLIFFVYQVKNMYDTLYWGDGIAFVLHHIFAGAAAWGGMFPGCCHFYSLFYMGFSEISTAILSLLANFDPEFGVEGLDLVFPKTKFVLGALFVASFIVCRLIMWPFWTYHFWRDTDRALHSDAPLAKGRKGYLRVIKSCCFGLSLIQLVFVAMIVQTGKEEYSKLMEAWNA